MIIYKDQNKKELENTWDLVDEVYSFKDNVGYDTKPYSVSKVSISANSKVNRIIQEGKDVVGNDHMFNFWAFPDWQPGLKVRLKRLPTKIANCSF